MKQGQAVGLKMMSVFERIVERKALIVWRCLTIEDLARMRARLPLKGIAFHIVVPTIDEAIELNAYIQSWER